MNKMPKILVIDDEMQMRKLLSITFSAHAYEVVTAENGKKGLTQAAMQQPDLLIVDLGLPDMDGKEVVKEFKAWSSSPVIVLTARDQENEKIEALDLGADDYVTKPFRPGELLARIRVCLRRSTGTQKDPIISCGDLTVDLLHHRVSVNGQEIKLTPTEYEIMKVLAQQAGKVLTHKQLLKLVWGQNYDEDTHYIRVYIGQLRKKIEPNPMQPRYIITETGIGYRLMG